MGHGMASPQSVGVAYSAYLWPKTAGIANIPYVVTSAPSALTTAIKQFNATFTGIIQFVARGSQADYVNFDFDSTNTNGICESSVGHVGGEQSVTGAYTCSLGTLLHEMGHVVGLFHEHSRSDRNSFVSFSYANVIKGSLDNFSQLADNDQNLTLYDYGSIMHYIPYAFSRNGGPTLESIPPGIPLSNIVGYTASDIDGIKRLYGAAPSAVTVTSNPPGLVLSVDGTALTTPHSFAWALNSTHTLSVAANAQVKNSAVYTYGRWSDSTSASHTITVAPGNGTSGQPANRPAVSVYTAHFVGLSRFTSATSPANEGSVTASPAPVSYPGVNGSYFVARQQVTLTASAKTGYAFLTWGGTSAPWGLNPKPTPVPDLGASFPVTAYLTTKPITTITTVPAGLGFQVDGTYWYGPQNFASDFFSGWTPGSTHTLASWSPQYPYSVNTRFSFTAWSDGGALNHTITVPTGASTLTGNFTPQYVPIAAAQPQCAATVSLSPSSSDGFYNSGTAVKFTSATATGWVLTGWLDDLTGRVDPQTLTVTDEELAVSNYNIGTTPLTVRTFSPASMVVGAAGGTVTINGSGFTKTSIVFVNNIYRASTYVSSTQLQVALTAADIASLTDLPIGVSNFPNGAVCSAYAAGQFLVIQ